MCVSENTSNDPGHGIVQPGLTINSNDLAIVTSTSTDTSTGTPQTEIVQAAITQAITVDATVSDTKTVSSTSASSSSTLSGTTTSAPSAKVTSTESATTSTAATSSSSSSTSASAKTTSAPTSTSQTETSSSSSTSASSSQSKISSTASVTDSTPLSSSSSTTSSVATPVAISAATTSAGPTTVQVFSTDGHLTTLTTQVFAATSTSSPPPAQSALSTTETITINLQISSSFSSMKRDRPVDGSVISSPYTAYDSVSSVNTHLSISNPSTLISIMLNKAAVGGVFGAAGLVFLILLLAVVLKIVRYRSRRQFEKDLDEQVEQEVRSGTPMFGVGKDDDGLSIMGGRVDGFIDPEKAAVARSGYGYPNTTAYPTYGGPIPPQATQQAYYSPNAPSGAPRRSPPQDQSPYSNFHDGSGGLSRTISRSSNRSYGSMQQPPMNAFASTIQNAGPVLAPATFAATTYGPYRHGSPAPSAQSQSWQSQNQAGFGARPGTPLSLTPGGGRGDVPTPPRSVYNPTGNRSESPAFLARYGSSRSPRNSQGENGNVGGRQVTQIQTGGLAAPSHGKEPPSPNVPLPNPFDQRDQ
ncbi:hypothetical protein F5880DRAFT_1615943 [Lentinula raphanica]|nr:hypothetical protein F5880DRAFT_1615943 [Lentinula raphanica]